MKYRKSFLILFIAVSMVALSFFAFVCLSAYTVKSEPYYGTYHGEYKNNKSQYSAVINKNKFYFTYESDKKYDYDYSNNEVKLSSGEAFVVAENYQVLYSKSAIAWHYNRKYTDAVTGLTYTGWDLQQRDGYFNAVLVSAGNGQLNQYKFFESGTFNFVYSGLVTNKTVIGSYSLCNGVLILTASNEISDSGITEKNAKSFYYIDNSYNIFIAAMVKNYTEFENSVNPGASGITDIPEETAKQNYTLTYTAGNGGKLIGALTQTVEKGNDGASVIAVADEGYEFMGWSDGVHTAERMDTNITDNITVTAQFREILKYTLTYTAGEGGTISGQLTQTVIENEDGMTVAAIANEGYEFIGWSDGVHTAERKDTDVKNNIAVTAQFMAVIKKEEYKSGNGTESEPYLISTAGQLANIENYPTACFKLQDDIVLNAVDDGQYNFKPLLSDDNMFNGTLDGNGHRIVNLTIYNTTTFYTGLFACIGKNGSVKNLALENVNISGTNYIGAVAGYSLGEIIDCSVSGEVTYLAENEYKVFIGGVVGRIENNIKCNTDINIICTELNGETYVGGIAGYLVGVINSSNKMNMSECSANGEVQIHNASSKVYAGGLFGYLKNYVDFYQVNATGILSVSGNTDTYAGGIVGKCDDTITINSSYTAWVITATADHTVYAGGFIGSGDSSYSRLIKISDSYTTGDITVNSKSGSYSGSCAGGFVGDCESITIINSYATGDITAISGSDAYIGGLVGKCDNEITINNSYTNGALTVTSRCVYVGGLVGIGYTTISKSYTTGTVTVTSAKYYAGAVVGYGYAVDISSSYTVSKISTTCDEKKYSGALVGYASSFKLSNVHWLYYADSGVEYAVGYVNSIGIPSSIGATKHKDISDFYSLDETLNNGLDELTWINSDSTSLPTLIKKEN